MTNVINTETEVLSDATQNAIYQKLASEMGLKTNQIIAFAKLYDEGASIPFIARYLSLIHI